MTDGISAAWSGLSGMFAGFDKIIAEADMASKVILAKSAAVVITKAQHNFEGAHKKGQPRVEGDKPNIVTGYLRRSIVMSPIFRFGIADYAVKVGPTAIYGRSVELGYKTQKAYPYFVPGVNDSTPEIGRIAAETWGAALH
jgi:HK97 gp10 family phage protein